MSLCIPFSGMPFFFQLEEEKQQTKLSRWKEGIREGMQGLLDTSEWSAGPSAGGGEEAALPHLPVLTKHQVL